jgi:DNA-binding IclR family transcriptional regulator
MVACGFLDATADGVQTGLRLWELATRESRLVRLKETARPFMEDLQSIIQQHTQLWVLDGAEVICVDRLSAPGAVANLARVAGRLPANLITPGIVLAAFGSRQAQDAFVASTPPALTSATPTRDLDLRRVLADTRRLGYARADGWIAPDVSGWGFPVRDAAGEVVAALSVVVPNEENGNAAAVSAARLASLSISRAMGWRGGPADRTRRQHHAEERGSRSYPIGE